ncbi:Glycine cleavage system transcriptional activator [Burkholderiales bacterium]|nr:Glycine cleavage system transcriptional activator [Burkholderiales bacterium]
MHKTLRRLPSLDFLRGFEASGRLLSFTRAAAELHLTQSALSRQVAAIEGALGVALFERRHRALKLTVEGASFHREVTAFLQGIARAAESIGGLRRPPGLTVTTTVSFASLWLVPRLSRFRARHPDLEVYLSADDRTVDLSRGEVDVAIRYVGQDTKLPPTALALFGERMLPVVSPAVARDPRTPLKRPADLAKHVLLHLDDPEGRVPWLNWPAWLAANGAPGLKGAGSLRFTLYDQVVQAAVGGQGVALGRLPLIGELLREGRLVAPFPKRYDSERGYAAITAPHAATREDVAAFVRWLEEESAEMRAQLGVVSAGPKARAPVSPSRR